MIIIRTTWYRLRYLIIFLILVTVAVGKFRGNSFDRLRHDEDDDEEEENESSEDSPPVRVTPQSSWLNFVRHSQNPKQEKGKERQKKKGRTLGLAGPPGPPGPRGPPGPPGAEVTKEILMKEFKDMVKEVAERRAEQLLAVRVRVMCPGCQRGNYTGTPLGPGMFDLDEVTVIPKINAGFHCRLRNTISLSSKTFLELKRFQMPFGGGAFHRGDVFDTKEGRFTAPRDGIYQFSSNIHFRHDGHKKGKKRKLRKRDSIRVLICIESLCQKHTSLEYTTGLESNSHVFTVSLSGLLHLRKGQYTSVYVDNASSRDISVQGGSDFTGVLMGV